MRDLDVIGIGSMMGEISAPRAGMRIGDSSDHLVLLPSGSATIFITALAALGAKAGFISRVGDDDLGRWMIDELAGLGIAALVFNHLLGFPGADPSTPLYGFVFLVALGIDYSIFLMTRVREEATRVGTLPQAMIFMAISWLSAGASFGRSRFRGNRMFACRRNQFPLPLQKTRVTMFAAKRQSTAWPRRPQAGRRSTRVRSVKHGPFC